MAFHGRNKSKLTRLLACVADANYRRLLFTGKFPSATQATRLPASENKQYKTYDRFHGNSPYANQPYQGRANQNAWSYVNMTLLD